MKAKVHAAGLDADYFIDSAGIGDWHVGQLPDSRMRERASLRGYRLDSRARQIRTEDFDLFDMLLVMDRDNYRIVTSKAPNAEARKRYVCLPTICRCIRVPTLCQTLIMATFPTLTMLLTL